MTPTDDEIRAMLVARAGRIPVGGTQAQALLAAAGELSVAEPRPRRGRFSVAGPVPRFAGAAASLAAAALAVVLVALPLANRPPASAVPSIDASAAIAPSAPAPTPTASPLPEARVLTPQELESLIESHGPDLAGLIVAVEGNLVADPSNPCLGPGDCVLVVLEGTNISVQPVGDIGPGPWDGSGPMSGVFAVRLTGLHAGSRVVTQYLGDILPAANGLAWSVGDLLAGEAREGGGYVAVRGWLVRTPFHPCPSIPAPPGNGIVATRPVYGCPTDDSLTDDRQQPLRADGSSLGPENGLYMPSGTYDEWAPDPTAFGLGVEPRQATYLLAWRAVPPCGPLADCYVGPEHFHWLMQGRLDPIPGEASDEPIQPAPETGYHPGGIPRSINGEPVLIGLDTQRRLAEATDDTPFLAGGFSWYGPIMCSGGIGLSDPNPLGARGCPTHDIAGVPGELFVPSGRIDAGDVPLVVRVHTNDPGAETCLPQTIDRCRARVVLDAIVWQGDDTTRSNPLGPGDAIGRVLSILFGDRRVVDDRTTSFVDEPRFVIPIACAAPWAELVYAVRGDPRLGLLAVFRDEATRESFQAATAPSAGSACLNSPIVRQDPPRWIGQDNILVLAFADDLTATAIEAQLGWAEGTVRDLIALPDASIDRSLETFMDYLDSRAARPNLDGDTPGLTFGPTPTNADGNPAIDVDAGWSADVLRRYEANALDGVVELVSAAPTRAQLGGATSIVDSTGAARVWLYRVTYPRATDPRFDKETFAVFQIPESTYRDWGIVRVDGEPFPVVPIRPSVDGPLPSGFPPIDDGSGDTPCLPAGHECP